MPAIETWLQQPAAQAVGWALLQFVWQGAAVGALTALALLALRRSASDVRYVVASIGLALMLTLPIVTGVQRYQVIAYAPNAGPIVSAAGAIVPAADAGAASAIFGLKPGATSNPGRGNRATAAVPTEPAGFTARVRSVRFEALLPLLMPLWLAGVSLLSLRLFSGWLWVQRLRTRGVAPADEALRCMASRLAKRLRVGRAVTLLESRLVEVPTVIGFLKPVVLLPAAALAGLSAQQIEAILAHELAHIRRHDYVVNLLQTLVETVLFYHPAVWWLSRRIRIERENCCDDLAVSLCGDPVAYATALADLEALRSSGPAPERHIAMAATGGSLLQRVRRLLGAPSSHSGRGPAWLAATAALSLIGCVAYSAEDRRPHDPRAGQTVAIHARELREIGRAIRTDVHAAQAAIKEAVHSAHYTIKGAGFVLRQTVGAAAPPRVAGPARPAPVLQPRVVPALAKATAQVPALGSLPSTIAAAALPIAPVGLPAPAAPAAPAAQAQQSTSISEHVSDSSGNWTWSNNGETIEVSYHGKFEFTDDDTDVRIISPGGWLKISDGKWIGRHAVEIRERNGQLEHLYYLTGSARPYEPEGRLWLQQNLPRFVRNSGIGADARVARLLKSGGPGAVLTEIGRVDSTYGKGIYYRQLFKQGSLTPEQYRQAMAQAGREMKSSSYELGQLLIAVADQLPADEPSRAAYFQAASGISSDYELRRVYSTMLKRGPVSPSILSGILQSARSIHSDYELSELLRQIVGQQDLDGANRSAFFALAAGMSSDYERHRVLAAAVGGTRQASADTLRAALDAGRFSSDYEASTFLQEIMRKTTVEGALSAAFFRVVDGIDSNYEKGRVLQAVVRQTGTGPDTLRHVLQSAQKLSGYELSQLLQTIAANHAVSGDLRDKYLAAAERLGDYEQTQAMAALVRSERRR